MRLEDPPRERRRFELVGGAIAIVMGVTALGFFAVVILAADEPEATPAATPISGTSGTSGVVATPTRVVEGVSLSGPVDLRSGPAPDVAIVTRLAATEAIHVLGRSEDGNWLVIGVEGRPEVTGWVPREAVAGVDPETLTVIASSDVAPADETATLSPDLPDLVVTQAYSQQNQLWVEVVNQGIADADGQFLVSVNGAPEVALDVKPGEPLRPGQELRAAVPGVYLQLRSNVEVRLLAPASRPEEEAENNTWAGIIGPDVPNDIEILSAAVKDPDEHLVVTIRNNSPIPIAGTFTVSVRETPPSTSLIGRERATVEVGSGETLELNFEEITEIDLTQVTVILSTDAIDDGMIANNRYPR